MVLLFFCSSKAFRFYEPQTAPNANLKWYDYLSIEGRAGIKFPEVYEEKKQTTSNGTFIIVKCIRNDDQFTFSANINPIPFPDPLASIELIMENKIRKYGATLVSDTDFVYKTYTGKESVFKDMSGTYYYRGIIINNIVYQMLIFSSKADIISDVELFFNSFDFKGQRK